jgi:hypothetical protein
VEFKGYAIESKREFLCRRRGAQRCVTVRRIAQPPVPGKPAVGGLGRQKRALGGCGWQGERVMSREVPTDTGLRGVTRRLSGWARAGPAGLKPASDGGKAHPAAGCHGGARRPWHIT